MNEVRPTVEERVAHIHLMEKRWLDFAEEHGFKWKMPQHYKNCLVIRWPHRKRKNQNFIDHERIAIKVDLAHALCQKFDAYDPMNPFVPSSHCLITLGIFEEISWTTVWTIPDKFKEMQDFVQAHVPAWTKVVRK